MKHEKQCKRKGNIDIPAYGERNLAKNLEENNKKILVEPCRVGEREKVLKKWFEQVKYDFLDRGFSKILKQFQNNFD